MFRNIKKCVEFYGINSNQKHETVEAKTEVIFSFIFIIVCLFLHLKKTNHNATFLRKKQNTAVFLLLRLLGKSCTIQEG